MRRLNVRELHYRTDAIIDQVAAGDVIVIQKRGVPVAELRPVGPAAKGFPPEHWERLKRFPSLRGDSGRYISRDRDRS
jgi:antitoxin (DNA-binding transcriptional repressor) of toxin-antitoxin stability system